MEVERECLIFPEQEMDVDDVFEKTVPFGKLQISLQIAVVCLLVMLGYQTAFLYFIGYNPPWTCINKSSSNFCNSNFGKEFNIDNINFTARCQLGRDEWKYTYKMQYSYIAEFDLVCTRSWIASVVGGSFYIGAAFGCFINGLVSDIYGRKPVILVTLILTVCVSFASSYVSAAWQLIVLRWFNGAVQQACTDNSFVMMSEYVTTRYRPISSNMSLIAINISSLLLDAVAYFVKDWRILQRYCSLPSVFLVFVFAFFPESPRWLLSVGKIVEAEKVLKYVAVTNGKPLLILKLKSPNISSDNKLKYTYLDLLKHLKVVIMILIIGFMWLTCGVTMFTSTLLMSDIGGNMYGNFAISTVVCIPTHFITMYLCYRFGRKRTTLIPMLLCGIISGIISVLLKLKEGGTYLVVMLTIIQKCFITIVLSSLYLWTFELYPTVVRLQGMAFAVFMIQVGSASAPYLTNVLQIVSVALPFQIMFILCIISTLLGTYLLETKNLPTRESFFDLFKTNKPVDTRGC